MTTTSTLPPPLSAPPTIGTLQGLLDGLQQPMHRGVPSPPSPPASLFEAPSEPAVPQSVLAEESVLDLTRLEQLAATSHADAAPAPAPTGPTAPTAAAAPPPRVPLTWSAGRAHSHPRRTAAVAVASAAVVALTALAATGELPLP